MSGNHAHTLLHTYIAASQLSEKLRDDEEAQMTLARVLSALRAFDDGPSNTSIIGLSAIVEAHAASIEQLRLFERSTAKKLSTLQDRLEKHAGAISDRQKPNRKLANTVQSLQDRIAMVEKACTKVSDNAISQSIIKFPPPEVFSRKIDEFGISVRSHNCLKSVNIFYVGDLVQHTKDDLFRIRLFGRSSFLDVYNNILNPLGLDLGTSTHGWQRPD